MERTERIAEAWRNILANDANVAAEWERRRADKAVGEQAAQ